MNFALPVSLLYIVFTVHFIITCRLKESLEVQVGTRSPPPASLQTPRRIQAVTRRRKEKRVMETKRTLAQTRRKARMTKLERRARRKMSGDPTQGMPAGVARSTTAG